MGPRILVVDDDRAIARLVRPCLEESNYEVLVAHDGETALHILRQERPDLVLLDLMLSDRDGLDQPRMARSREGMVAIPIIGFESGRNHAEIESLNPKLIAVRVADLLRQARGGPASPRIIQAGDLTMDLDAHKVEIGGEAVHLTPTEFGLLRALAERPGHALSRKEMIENSLGFNSYDGLERTVDSHIKNLRHKLNEAGGAAHLIETVFGVGYRLDTRGHP